MSSKARRAVVHVGSMEVEGFCASSGAYFVSQSQAAEAIGKPESNARRFPATRLAKFILGQDPTLVEELIEVEGRSRIRAIPIETVSAYWLAQAASGNRKAIALVWALLMESLERRFDAAFKVELPEPERESLTNQRFARMERWLNEAGTVADDTQRENEALWEYLREQGTRPLPAARGGKWQ